MSAEGDTPHPTATDIIDGRGATSSAPGRAVETFATRTVLPGEGGTAPREVAFVDETLDRGQVRIDDEVFDVAEGDMLLDSDERQVYDLERRLRIAQRELLEQARVTAGLVTPGGGGTSALVGIASEGKIVRWAPDVVLSYCVLRQTFSSEEQYDLVVENMRRATHDWMTTCGVVFQHMPDLDDSASTSPDGVLFPVRQIDARGAFIAAAFFPTDPRSRWRLLIDPSYFGTTFDKVGVLRHELGHTLGFRHEHIRSGAPAVCPHESTADTIDLTQYDPQSVMHYFCGGVGSRALAITEVDRAGSQLVYGPPLLDFVLLKP